MCVTGKLFMNKTVRLTLIIFLLSATQAVANGVDNKHNLTGYYKALMLNTRSTSTKEDFGALTNRLRLKYNHEFNDQWQVHVTLDNEAIIHDAGNLPDFAFTRSMEQDYSSTLDWDKVSSDNDHVYSRHAIHRAYVKYYSSKFQAVVGKQAIDWGKMRFYSPIDLFNSPAAIAVEHEERIGADAINLNFSIDDFSGVNLIYVPDDKDSKNSFGAKLYKTIGTYDVSVIAGEFRRNMVFGVAFDGYVKDAGLRGEVTYNKFDNGREFARASIGMDYNVNDKIYLLMEHFYNGGADDNNASTFSSSFSTARDQLSLKKHLSSLWFQYKITPLIDFNTFVVYDWEGRSGVANPEVKYGLSQNLDLRLGSQLFWGTTDSEFGLYEHLYYFEVQWYF